MDNWNDGVSLSPEIMLALGQRKMLKFRYLWIGRMKGLSVQTNIIASKKRWLRRQPAVRRTALLF
jgi:hypothetical protein